MENDFKNIVSTDWLEQHLEAPDIRVKDSSWYFSHDKRNAQQEYEERLQDEIDREENDLSRIPDDGEADYDDFEDPDFMNYDGDDLD